MEILKGLLSLSFSRESSKKGMINYLSTFVATKGKYTLDKDNMREWVKENTDYTDSLLSWAS